MFAPKVSFGGFLFGGGNLNDEYYMRRALSLAARSEGWCSPNPMVGAVIVKGGEIIGEGYHERRGDLHAERAALAHCSADPRGATMYVTLEPCCHYGRQPPCTDAILEAGIARVVCGSGDPNPLVAGKGTGILRANGVEVTEHVLEEECRALNEVFFHYITRKTPFVALKYAMTLDGKIAAYTGESKWITGPAARVHVHRLRNKYRGIMCGVGTVLADDPALTCRIDGGRNPVRIVCDGRLRTPINSQLVRTARETPVIIATLCSDAQRARPYLDAGCEVIVLPERGGHFDLAALMSELGRREIDGLLIEGGATLNWSALEAGIVRKVYAYVAPMLLGGTSAKSPVGGQGFPDPGSGARMEIVRTERLGTDILIECEVKRDCSQA